MPSSRYDGEKAARFWKTQLMPAVRALPGVEAVAAANCAPMSLAPTEHTRFATRFGIEGRTFDPGRYPVAQLSVGDARIFSRAGDSAAARPRG